MARVKIGNVYPSDEYLLQRCAPAGYGLGFYSLSEKPNATPDNIDTLLSAGWYQYYDTNFKSLAGLGFSGGLFVVPSFNGAVQLFYPRIQEYIMPGTYGIRKYEDGTWSDWYIENPPMGVGMEYRTTERYMRKPVYVSLVNVGKFPESGLRDVDTGIVATGIVRFNAASGYYALPLADNMEISTSHNGETVVVQLNTKGERIIENDVYVTLYYIKD